ncbi:unnamed protein product, partial [Polarella glacialis]
EQSHSPYKSTYSDIIQWFQTYSETQMTCSASCSKALPCLPLTMSESPKPPVSSKPSSEPSRAEDPSPAAILASASPGADSSKSTLRPTSPPLGDTSPMQVSSGGSGRMGNNIQEILRGLMYAKLTGVQQVSLNLDGNLLPQIFDPQAKLLLTSSFPEIAGNPSCPDRVGKPAGQFYNYQGETCPGVDARAYHDLAIEYLYQAFLPAVRTCVESEDTDSADADKTLTVHLRGQDLWGMGEFETTASKELDMHAGAHHWLWHQPPCTMYRKIIVDEGYTSVLVITSSDLRHTCVQWFQQLNQSLPVKVRIQAGSLSEDYCALTRAQNLVLGYSTLSDTAALLSKRLKRLYFREFAGKSLLDCSLWQGTEARLYKMPITEGSHESYENTYSDIIRWFRTYSESSMTVQTRCGLSPSDPT